MALEGTDTVPCCMKGHNHVEGVFQRSAWMVALQCTELSHYDPMMATTKTRMGITPGGCSDPRQQIPTQSSSDRLSLTGCPGI